MLLNNTQPLFNPPPVHPYIPPPLPPPMIIAASGARRAPRRSSRARLHLEEGRGLDKQCCHGYSQEVDSPQQAL